MIAWESAGSGVPLVLVHGITEDRRGWDPVVPLLEDAFRCVRLDLRGHGESSDADDYSALAMAGDVATVVAEAGVDRPLLVGHSLGAVVVTAYATQAPCRGVVNIDQPLRLGDFAAALQTVADELRGPHFAETVTAIVDSLGTDRLDDRARAYATAKHEAARREVVLGVWDLVLDSDPDELTGLAEGLLAGVTVPYLALHGSAPAPGYAEWFAAHVPQAQLEVWDGTGHYPHLVEPERFAERVRRFASGAG